MSRETLKEVDCPHCDHGTLYTCTECGDDFARKHDACDCQPKPVKKPRAKKAKAS